MVALTSTFPTPPLAAIGFVDSGIFVDIDGLLVRLLEPLEVARVLFVVIDGGIEIGRTFIGMTAEPIGCEGNVGGDDARIVGRVVTMPVAAVPKVLSRAMEGRGDPWLPDEVEVGAGVGEVYADTGGLVAGDEAPR
jgi:hypothetical protein